MKLRQFVIAALLGLAAVVGFPPALADSSGSAALATLQAVPQEVLNPDVRQDTIRQTVCVSGYTASVRPSTTYTNGVKLKLMREQGLPASAAPEFELDHRIPLALGGHSRSLQNLMLQRWDGADGAKAKDRLERRLQRLVCAQKLPLDDARRAIYGNWQSAYLAYVRNQRSQ
jgi:hypothetical protein